MSLTTIQNEILKPFVDETLENLKTMAHMNGHCDDGFVDDPEQFRFKGYAICCETQGHIDGVVLLHHYPETAIAMGNAIRASMLGDDEELDEITEDMSDALAEWGNTVIGRAMSGLAEKNLGIRFEPPYFVHDTETMASILTGVTEIISVPVHVENVGRFYFNYLIRSISEDFSEPASKGRKVMVVDDMKMIRRSLRRFLGELGYDNVVEAENGLVAVEKFKSEQPDIVFLDVVMPELSGNEALKQIRAMNKDAQIVMLSSVADNEIIDECKALGISGYIIKPLTTETGAATLGKFLS